MSGAAGRIAAWIDELLFPEKTGCLCCGRALDEEEGGLCAACTQALEALEARQEENERRGMGEIAPGLAYVHAAYPYEGQARALILRLKFESIRAAAVPLARAMCMLPTGEEDVLVPVPTTRRRLRRRGFNQAALLAGEIARELGMPVENALERVDERAAQSTLSAGGRRRNLVGCMRTSADVSGRRILLVDDVYTTGSTAQEAARALLEAGARSVGMLSAARASAPDEEARRLPFWP